MHDTRAPVQCGTHVLTVPIWPINTDNSCSCGQSGCPSAGKHPRPHGAINNGVDGAGYGVLTGAAGSRGSGLFVVDCDERPGVSGIENFAQLCRMHGEQLPETLIVSTGGKWVNGQLRPGYHFYFRHPGFPVKSSVGKLAPCVDVKGDPSAATGFSFVVGPGSKHVNGVYSVAHAAPICDAPGWLLEWAGLRKDSTPEDISPDGDPFAYAPQPVDTTTPEGQSRIAKYIAECRGETGDLAPAVEGSGTGQGSNAMYHACAHGLLYWLLPVDTVRDIVATYYNPRCSPPWNDQEINHKLRSVLTKNREITPGPAPEEWGQGLIRSALVGAEGAAVDGEAIGPRAHNLSHAYTMAVGDVVANGKLSTRSTSAITYQLRRHPDWIGVLQYDEFSESVRAVDPPIPLDAETGPLTESDVTAIRIWFEVRQDTQVSNESLRCCIDAVARACKVHAVRDYLLGLPPGDPNVLVGLSARWFGTTEQLDEEMLVRFLVGAARRALLPGTKVDTMLVLYGDQGHKKSQWIGALFSGSWTETIVRRQTTRMEIARKAKGLWHSEQMPDLGKGADSSNSIATVWGQEFPELDKLLRADPSTAKDFLSRVVDKYRPAYGRNFIVKARQAVFIGTTNEREVLRDPTGERRYWIIEVLRKIDCELVAAERSAVWAAVMGLAMQSGYQHWFETGDEWDTLLKARHVDYAKGDGWTESVMDYLSGRAQVELIDIARDCIFKGDLAFLSKYTDGVRGRLVSILRRLGCEKRPKALVYDVHPTLKERAPSASEAARRRLAEGAGAVLALVPKTTPAATG